MKINWGTGIAIAIVLFMSFILYFVIRISTETNVDHNLVTEEYYQDELKYQEKINAIKNAKKLPQNIRVIKSSEGLRVVFPKEMDATKIKGKISLYRPSNKKLDAEYPISLTNATQLIPSKKLVGGRWNLVVSWNYNSKNYLFKEELIY